MPTLYFHPSNCGMRDLVIHSSDPKAVILEVCKACVHPKFVSGKMSHCFAHIAAHVIFSQAAMKSSTSYGDKLHKFIEANGLGAVLKSEAVPNPDHGPNYITAYIWTPSNTGLEAWWESNKPVEKTTAPKIGSPNYYNSVPMYCPGLPPVIETKEK